VVDVEMLFITPMDIHHIKRVKHYEKYINKFNIQINDCKTVILQSFA